MRRRRRAPARRIFSWKPHKIMPMLSHEQPSNASNRCSPAAVSGLPCEPSRVWRCTMSVSRREFLQAGAMAVAGTNVVAHAQSGGRVDAPPASVRALVFDTFGTVVDWRTSVAREVEALAKRKGVALDAVKFADAWRAGYGPSMNRVRTGELPWTKLDALHRMSLDRILADFNFTGLTGAEKE